MKRAGFTMIELIFVIVILGILAAVALPKMTETATSAKTQNAESFIATLNRTVAPTMWAQAVKSAGGSVQGLTIADYIDLPSGYTIALASCTGTAGAGADVGGIDTTALAAAEDIFCVDGTSTTPPLFSFKADGNTTVQQAANRGQ